MSTDAAAGEGAGLDGQPSARPGTAELARLRRQAVERISGDGLSELPDAAALRAAMLAGRKDTGCFEDAEPA